MGDKQQADFTFSSEPAICSFGCACSLTHDEKTVFEQDYLSIYVKHDHPSF